MVMSSVADVAFIAKIEVRDWPIFGLLARLQKSVFIVREEKRKTGNQASEIAARMADGEIIVLFPEGTTSDGNRLLEVKSSLFGAAAMAVRRTRRTVRSSCSRLRLPIQRRTALRWAAITARWPAGQATLNSYRTCVDVVQCARARCRSLPSARRSNTVPEFRTRKDVGATVARRIRTMLRSRLRGGDYLSRKILDFLEGKKPLNSPP